MVQPCLSNWVFVKIGHMYGSVVNHTSSPNIWSIALYTRLGMTANDPITHFVLPIGDTMLHAKLIFTALVPNMEVVRQPC